MRASPGSADVQARIKGSSRVNEREGREGTGNEPEPMRGADAPEGSASERAAVGAPAGGRGWRARLARGIHGIPSNVVGSTKGLLRKRRKEPLANAIALRQIRRILDPDWYRATYPDLAATDPAEHYLAFGAREGRVPHPLFDPDWYARTYPGLAERGINPLLHFIETGHAAGTDPHPLFDVGWYLDRSPDVRTAGENALVHYIRHGAEEGRSTHPLFDVDWYKSRNPSERIADPLRHYLAGRGRDPHPLFDDRFYRKALPDLSNIGLAPLAHYVLRGAALGFDPNPYFDTDWYVRNHETLAETGENPLVHYLRAGAAEGRDPHPDFDRLWYAHANADAIRAGQDPLTHYLRYGQGERRAIRPPDADVEICAVLDIPYEIRRASDPTGRDVCVFVTYSADGAIAEHVRLHVEALRTNGVMVVLTIATDGIAQPLPPFCDAVEGLVIRRNHGWDFAAWAATLAAIPDLWQARCLILVNDSVFGPIDPHRYAEMIERVRASTCDVIALTDSRQVTHHRMSYFVAIKNAGLTAPHLHTFWNGVKSQRDKQAVIDSYETVPLADLTAAGLTWEVLFPARADFDRARNPTLEDWRDLVARGFPFLKVQLLRDRLVQSDPRGWREAVQTNPALRAAIETHLERGVPAGMRSTRPVPAPRHRYKRQARLKTWYGAIEATRPTRPTDLALEVPFRFLPEAARLPDRVAVIAHIFYPDLCAEIRGYLDNIPVRADLFISTDTEAKRAAIEQAFAGHAGRVTVSVFANVGRDIAPMLVGFAGVFAEYEVFLHIHSKKSPHESRMAPWRGYLLDTLLGSPEIVRSILGLLAQPDIGLVFPEHFEPVRNLLNWGGNYDTAHGLLARAGVTLTKEMALEFPSSSFYWGRTDALRDLLDLGLGWGDFPLEAGQVDGTIAHAIERSILHFVEARHYRWAKVARADRIDPSTLVPVLDQSALPDDLLRTGRSLLHNRLPALEGRARFPDLANIATRPDRRTRPRLNLIIPTLKPELRFGGITTAIRLFEEIATALGPDLDLRIICQTRALDLESMIALPGWRLVGLGVATAFPKTVVDVTDQESGELDLRASDIFVATAWWTAVTAYDCQARQAAYFGARSKVVYLIQDHEPDFYGWSPQFGLAQATYAHGERTIALVNSEELAAFMARTYALTDAYVVRFQLNPAIARAMSRRPRERIILIYGRPNTPRNCFSTLCDGLARWQQANPETAARWQVVSAGESYHSSDAGGVQNLTIHGKLALGDYADLLSRASVGLSLMLSPHPSYPPLEMAQAGLQTITNGYDGKDLSRRSANITSIPHATPQALHTALDEAVKRAEAMIGQYVEITPIAELPCEYPDFDAATIADRLRAELTAVEALRSA